MVAEYIQIHIVIMSTSKNMMGSGSIGSGGYGCVFLPHLSCETETENETNTGQTVKYVTKLMTNNHAETEFRLIRSFDKRLRTIPAYSNYFLVANVTKCRPGPLTKRDLRAYDKQCKPLIKKNITRKNINRSLSKVTALRIPYGGDTIDDYWMTHVNSRSDMETMVASMHSLLNRGIIPMNRMGLYHGDIKSSNIMYYQGNSKLIDWGLAFDTAYKRDQNADGVSRLATYRPFQFNVLPSCIILNAEFRTAVAGLLKTNNNPNRQSIIDFVAGFVSDWNGIRGEGSISILATLYDKLVPYAANKCGISHTTAVGPYAKNSKDDAVPAFAVVYIANILEKYIRDKEFHLEEYYREVYLKSLDIWGFAISFLILFNLLCKNDATLNNSEKRSLGSLCNMYSHILEMDATPIDVGRVATHVGEVVDNYRRGV
jgi:serine/threonine protein kinase